MPRTIRTTALLLLITGMQTAFAEESFVKEIWRDGKYLATSPSRLETSDMPWLAGSALALGGAFVDTCCRFRS